MKLLPLLPLVLCCVVNESCAKMPDREVAKQIVIDNLDKDNIKSTMDRVAQWQIDNFRYSAVGSGGMLHDYGIDAWTSSTFYIGLLKWAKESKNAEQINWLEAIGEKNGWCMPENFKNNGYKLYHADELCIGQLYLGLYDSFKMAKMKNGVQKRLDWIIENPGKESMAANNKQTWSWCDALFMAPTTFTLMSRVTGDERYVKFMDTQFRRTYDYLYDKDENLFFRDDSYFGKTEANGKKIFWGRGNGWVAAGLSNVLNAIPEDSELRPYYHNMLGRFVERLVEFQDKDGFWHASLLDPASYPSPETSSTGLITYALAYAIQTGAVDEDKYMPYLLKAWQALNSAVFENGKLGWVQPIGADPKKVTRDMTSNFGVGAFLMAGTVVYQMAK